MLSMTSPLNVLSDALATHCVIFILYHACLYHSYDCFAIHRELVRLAMPSELQRVDHVIAGVRAEALRHLDLGNSGDLRMTIHAAIIAPGATHDLS